MSKKGKIKTVSLQMGDPILPFSITINKEELPSNYSDVPFNPQIYYGAQANGFYGNIRYKLFGTTRVFFFQIQPGQQNMNNYYTITVVVPGKKSKILPAEQRQLDIINGLCAQFESKNHELVQQYTEEAVKLVNLAVQHVGTTDWGSEILPGTPVGMTVVFNQLDLGQLGEYYDPSNFPIAKLDFNPSSIGGKKRRHTKRRRHTKKRNTRKIRKTIKRK